MLWVFVALAVGELMVVHLLLTLRWPVIGWPLLVVSGATVIWLVLWIRSFGRYPHSLSGDVLRLRIGSLPDTSIRLAAIGSISTNWCSGEHRGKGARNLVPVAYPNRMLRLTSPIQTRKGMCDRIAFRVDDPVSFDAAMASVGIQVN